MGLDLIDIQFRLEKVFQLELNEEFWQEVHELTQQESGTPPRDVTVGQIRDVLVRRLKSQGRLQGSKGIVEANLNEVVTKLRSRYSHWQVTPEADFCSLHGRPLCRADWPELGELFRVDMPAICWSGLTLLVVVFVPLMSLVVLALWQPADLPWGYTATAALAVLSALILWRLKGESKRFPPQIRTVQDLADHVLLQRCEGNPVAEWPEDLVWFMLREILVDGLGVDHDEVIPSATLIHDLGAD